MANIREMGALITFKDKLQHFLYLMIIGCDSSPKQNKVIVKVIVILSYACLKALVSK